MRRSPFFYVGDKYKILPQILKYFPKNIGVFVEPFVGGGSVFLNVEAKKYLLNDIDVNMIKLHSFFFKNKDSQENIFSKIENLLKKYGLSYSYLKDIVPLELKQKYKKTYYAKFNKNGYLKLKEDFNKKEDLLSLYILLIYGFNRFLRFNKSGIFNLPVGNVDFNKNTYNSLVDYFSFVKKKEIQYFNKDFKEFILSLVLKDNDFIYFDPPYLISSSEYNKIWNIEKEKSLLKLLDFLNKKGFKWAISNIINYKGRENKIFKDWAKKYKIFEVNSNYISFNDNSLKDINEVLVINYEKKSC